MPIQRSRPISRAELAAEGRLKSVGASSGDFSNDSTSEGSRSGHFSDDSTRGSSDMMPWSPEGCRATGRSASPVPQLRYDREGHVYDDRSSSPVFDLPEQLSDYVFRPIIYDTYLAVYAIGYAVGDFLNDGYYVLQLVIGGADDRANFVTDPSYADSAIGAHASYTDTSYTASHSSYTEQGNGTKTRALGHQGTSTAGFQDEVQAQDQCQEHTMTQTHDGIDDNTKTTTTSAEQDANRDKDDNDDNDDNDGNDDNHDNKDKGDANFKHDDGGYPSFGREELNYPIELSTYMSLASASPVALTSELSMPGSVPRVSGSAPRKLSVPGPFALTRKLSVPECSPGFAQWPRELLSSIPSAGQSQPQSP